MRDKYIAWFTEVSKKDIGLVGGKGANLGEMTQAGFPVPPGFIVTAQAYYQFLKENHLEQKINLILTKVNYENSRELQTVSHRIKKLLIEGTMPAEIVQEIRRAYTILGKGTDILVAVRSSATAEDLPTASFAGQQETYLNVYGNQQVLEKVRKAWASLFDARAIFYRHENKFDLFKVGIAIPVQKMVESDQSGIMFSIDPVTNDQSKIVIEAIYGLGELIVQGVVTPDHYEVDKQHFTILTKKIVKQTKQLVKRGGENKEIHVPENKTKKQKLTDEEIIELARLGRKLEDHYHFSQDAEWAIEQGKIYLVQTRPVTTIKAEKKKEKTKIQEISLKNANIILTGDPASPGIASGRVVVLHSAKEIDRILQGDVLVASQTNPDFVPAMKRAVAIVTDYGGRTSHAAIVSREIGIPAIVGTATATKILKDGEFITVNGSSGEIYEGAIEIKHATYQETIMHTTRTKVYVNLAEPDFADNIAKRNVDGVGLLRAEFMMAGIGEHPRKFIEENRQNEFVTKLAGGLETFCRAFHPRPVIYRASDFKTNEYKNLKGGKEYEPEEPNPMLGYRGAFRYIHDPQVFKLELEAIKVVREKKGLKNLWLMIPFVRTVEELIAVKKIIHEAKLQRSETFKLWMMVEIPSNVILLDDFISAGIDGVSVGSNDLTMLLLGTDRDNNLVAPAFNEQNKAVLWALKKVITTARKHMVTASLCGQAASSYPLLLKNLVRWGITSVSVSPDAIDTTRKYIAEFEKNI